MGSGHVPAELAISMYVRTEHAHEWSMPMGISCHGQNPFRCPGLLDLNAIQATWGSSWNSVNQQILRLAEVASCVRHPDWVSSPCGLREEIAHSLNHVMCSPPFLYGGLLITPGSIAATGWQCMLGGILSCAGGAAQIIMDGVQCDHENSLALHEERSRSCLQMGFLQEVSFCDALPRRLAVGAIPLQRQSMLLTAQGLTNSWFSCLREEGDIQHSVLCNGHGKSFYSEITRKSHTSQQTVARRWLHDHLQDLQHTLDSMITGLLQMVWVCLMAMGRWIHQAFMWLAATGAIYMTKLVLYAISLKGGTHNCDNLLQSSRKICSECPLTLGTDLNDFSPRLSGQKNDRAGKVCKKYGLSREVIWMIVVMCFCFQKGFAANAGRFEPQPTFFPRHPDTWTDEGQNRGLLANGDVAQDPVTSENLTGPNRGAITFGGRLYLFSMVMLQQVIGSSSWSFIGDGRVAIVANNTDDHFQNHETSVNDRGEVQKWMPRTYNHDGFSLGADTPHFNFATTTCLMLAANAVDRGGLALMWFSSCALIEIRGGAMTIPLEEDDVHWVSGKLTPVQEMRGHGAVERPAIWPQAVNDRRGDTFNDHCDGLAAVSELDLTDDWAVSCQFYELCTVIDAAKTDALWRLCGELGSFLAEINAELSLDSLHVQRTYQGGSAESDAVSAAPRSHEERCEPRRILLEESLERKPIELPTCHMKSEANLDMLEWLQEGYTVGMMSRDVGKLGPLHESSARALSSMPHWHENAPFEEMQLFTDGSFQDKERDMAWAVVAVVRWREVWSFAGFFSGSVILHEADATLVPSAYLAEVAAIFHAMILASNVEVHTTIIYDCISAAEIAKHAGKQFGSISLQMAALATILRQLDRWPNWGHIKGHNGDPFNELADRVAKTACKGHYAHPPHEEDRVSVAISEGWLAWLWPHVASSHAPACWPHFNQDGCVYEPWVSQAEMKVGDHFHASHGQNKKSENSQQGAAFNMKFATYNCLSLKLAGQVECIEESCLQQHLHVVGLQETKVQWHGAAHAAHFLRFSSAANKHGLEGCQLWFSKGSSFGQWDAGETFGWDPSSFAIAHESERCIAVSAKAGGLEFIRVSAHARTSVSQDKDVQDFWRFLSSIVAGFPPKAIRLFFLDANAHFDECVAVDEYYLPTNMNAQLLRDFAHAHGLVISDLWTPDGAAIYTWVSPQGNRRCLDFIAAPKDFRGHFQVQGSWDVIDRFSGIDHSCLGLGCVSVMFAGIVITGSVDLTLKRCALLKDKPLWIAFFSRLHRYRGQSTPLNTGASYVNTCRSRASKPFLFATRGLENRILMSKHGICSGIRRVCDVCCGFAKRSFPGSSFLRALGPGVIAPQGSTLALRPFPLCVVLLNFVDNTMSVLLSSGSDLGSSNKGSLKPCSYVRLIG